MTVTATGWTVDQTSHWLLCDALRETVHAGLGANDRIGSIRYRASAVLYLLPIDHPIDRRGRCRSCRRPGTIIGRRRRRCRIYLKASYWLLRQPDEAILRSHLAEDLGLGPAPAPRCANSATTNQLCRIASDHRRRRRSPVSAPGSGPPLIDSPADVL